MPKPRDGNTGRPVVAALVVVAVAALVRSTSVSSGSGGGGYSSVVAVAVALVVVLVVVGVDAVRWFAKVGRLGGNGRAGGLVVGGAGRLLPATVRETYVEEWRGWLYDLRVDGVPWYHRLLELLSIMRAAPRLAITLRLAGQQAVD